MDAPQDSLSPPRRILLATDLTSRADRALDRALQLVHQWGSQLHVVHAVTTAPAAAMAAPSPASWQRSADPAERVARAIRQDMGADLPGLRVHIEEGLPAKAIVDVASREACDLVLMGETRDRFVGPLAETTVERVVRTAPVSVMVVKDRVRGPYRHVVVGTDFTDEARQALSVATRLFPEASFMLMHASPLPHSSVLQATSQGQDWTDEQRSRLRDDLARTGLPSALAGRVHINVDTGAPAAMLRRYVQDSGADLAVIGSHRRGLLFDSVIGESRRIVDAVPGDVLVVRAIA